MHDSTLKIRLPMDDQLSRRLMDSRYGRIEPIGISMEMMLENLSYNIQDKCYGGLWLEATLRGTFPVKEYPIPSPIPMLLICPACKHRHIDEGEFATKIHHTHSCQYCGTTWRPAIVATVGVRFLPGFKNEL